MSATWRVYQIVFRADGGTYVGRTRQKVRERVYRHRRRPVNAELAARLAADDAHEVSVLSAHASEEAAARAEEAAIAALERPINVAGARAPRAVLRRADWPRVDRQPGRDGRRGRLYERRDGAARCSVCRRVLPSAEFTTDRTRSSGLSSRCRRCERVLNFERGPRRAAIKAALAEGYFDHEEERMKNSLEDVHNHLVARMERLGDESLTGEELAVEIERAKATCLVAREIADVGKLSIDAAKLAIEHGTGSETPAHLAPRVRRERLPAPGANGRAIGGAA